MTDQLRCQMGKTFASLADALETGNFGEPITVALTTLGSELGVEELIRGAEIAQNQDPGLKVVLVGPSRETQLQLLESNCEASCHKIMEDLLSSGKADAAVTLHYDFPLGVSTIGRVTTPARGRPMFIASTTGAAAYQRVEAMVLNAIGGIAVAKSMGIACPTLGILNVEGARQGERILKNLKERGYPIAFSDSVRSDGGIVLRGNDLLTGSADVVVCDTLTGNLLMKLFSAYTSGGTYEVSGWGYGPGVGENWGKVIGIISRASGAPVVARAIQYVVACSKGLLPDLAKSEFRAAWQAGLGDLLVKDGGQIVQAVAPPKKPVDEEITGIDILELEDAVQVLWAEQMYAETGMGCAGPVIMVSLSDKDKALDLLRAKGYM